MILSEQLEVVIMIGLGHYLKIGQLTAGPETVGREEALRKVLLWEHQPHLHQNSSGIICFQQVLLWISHTSKN